LKAAASGMQQEQAGREVRALTMDAGTILTLGAAILGLGSLGLLIVRSSNQRLRGLGWLGIAFASGAFGAIQLTLTHLPLVLRVLGSDLCVLLSFVLLQMAAMDLMGKRPLADWRGLLLLAGVTVSDVLSMMGYGSGGRLRMSTVSLLTARTLWRAARQAERVPALFCALVLTVFAAFNLLRAVVVSSGWLYRWHWFTIVVTLSYALYIAVALGLAFGFFWMSTAQLSLQLEHMAGTDPLTRLYNRRTFLKVCEREMRLWREKARPFSILMMDLDHFKKINDLYGHQVGDAALVAVVESMQSAVRGSDILARWGGEEFAALLPNASLESAYIVAERVRAGIERIEMPIASIGARGHALLRMTISIGVATCEGMDDIDSVMGRADQGLYLAKDSGRNCVLAAG
jgi:diguanylate cyclase (GGDEF)-like protein